MIEFSLQSKDEKHFTKLVVAELFYQRILHGTKKTQKRMSKACSDENSGMRGSCSPAAGLSWV